MFGSFSVSLLHEQVDFVLDARIFPKNKQVLVSNVHLGLGSNLTFIFGTQTKKKPLI